MRQTPWNSKLISFEAWAPVYITFLRNWSNIVTHPLFLFLCLLERSSLKSLGSVVSNRIGMKFEQDRSSQRLKSCTALNGTPMAELRNVTCHMGWHSVTCNPTQVNGHYSIYLPRGWEGWVEVTGYFHMDSLSVSQLTVAHLSSYGANTVVLITLIGANALTTTLMDRSQMQ